MKTILFWLLCLLVLTGGCQNVQVSQNEFLIEGHIKELPDSCIIQLMESEGNILKVAAIDTVIQGYFTFRDTLSVTKQWCLVGRGVMFPRTHVDVWTAPGSYTSISGKGANICTWKIENEVAEQQYVNMLLDATRKEWEILGASMIEENKWFTLRRENKGNDSIERLVVQKIDSICELSDPIDLQITLKELEQMKKLPITDWWLTKMEERAPLLQYASDGRVAALFREVVGRMTDDDRQTSQGKVIESYLRLSKPVRVGDEMADADLYDVNGQLHHLAELKGKYILIDFWSRGCGPCIASFPELEEIGQIYASQLAVVSICEDPEKLWKEFVKEKKLKGYQWNQLDKTNIGLRALYPVNGVPCYVLISPVGKVVDMWCGYDKGSLKSKLESLLEYK